MKRAKFSFHICVCISTLFKQRLISINSASPSLCDSVCMYVRKRKWTNVKTKETFTARERNKERFLKLMGIITSYAAHNNTTYITIIFEYAKQVQFYGTRTIGSPLFFGLVQRINDVLYYRTTFKTKRHLMIIRIDFTPIIWYIRYICIHSIFWTVMKPHFLNFGFW